MVHEQIESTNPEKKIDEAFLVFSEGHPTLITLKNLQKLSKDLTENNEPSFLEMLINECGGSEKAVGGITKEQFTRVMNKTGLF